MKLPFIGMIAAAALLVATVTTAAGQEAPSTANYTGPRYPGGPDSLRALVARSTRLTTPAPAGRMLVQFELKPDGKAYNLTMVRPPKPMNPALVKATATALDYIEAHMSAWQPGIPELKNSGAEPKITLVVDFTAPPATQPYAYADQFPIFPDLEATARKGGIKAAKGATEGSTINLIRHTQRQSRYPAASLRQKQQGTVYVYFEVAENGAVEHGEVLGTSDTVGKELGEEVLRVVHLLPSATAPAKVAGRPVRLYYALPVVFKVI